MPRRMLGPSAAFASSRPASPSLLTTDRQPTRRRHPAAVRLPLRPPIEPPSSARGGRAALPVPTAFAGRARARSRLIVFVDVDSMSRSGSHGVRVADAVLRNDLARVADAVARLGVPTQTWFCCSSLTARAHLSVLTAARNNTWRVGCGPDGAHRLLGQGLADVLASSARRDASCVLVAADGAHAGAVETLCASGVPTWVITPPTAGSPRALRRAATAVSWLDDPSGRTPFCAISARRDALTAGELRPAVGFVRQ